MTDIKPPHAPHIVERSSGYSEFVLERTRPSRWSEDVLGCSILLTIDGGDFNGVRWPTRKLKGGDAACPTQTTRASYSEAAGGPNPGGAPQPDAAPGPSIGSDIGGAWFDCECLGCVAKRKRAAPPVPVPPAEMAEIENRLKAARAVVADLRADPLGIDQMALGGELAEIRKLETRLAALTAAQPSADHRCTCIPPIQAADDLSLCDRCRRKLIVRVDAGEVTEEMLWAFAECWWGEAAKQIFGETPSKEHLRDSIRAALQARGSRS